MSDIEEQLQDQFRLLRQRLDLSAPDPARVFTTNRRRRWTPSRLLLAISGIVLALGGSAGLAIALTGSHPSSKPVPVATTPSSAPATPATIAPSSTTSVPAQGSPGVVANCTAPGNAAYDASTEPTSIVIACADDGIRFESLSWSSWTQTSAVGSGQLWENNCIPYCAAGTFHQYPASVTLSDPVDSVNGPVFSSLVASFTVAGPNGAKTESLSLPLPPAPSPTCSAADLQVSVSGPGGSAAFTEESVQFTNVSSQACHMEGFPGFDLLTASGSSILNASRGCPWAAVGWCPTMLDYLYLRANGGTAFFGVAWQSIPESGQTCVDSASALITPPNAFDQLTLPLRITVCGEPLCLGIGTVQY
jgi:hypothetical protein